MSQKDDLNGILDLEAKQAMIGISITLKKREYCEKYAKFKKGDRVKVRGEWSGENEAIVESIEFDTKYLFAYMVSPVKNGTNERKKNRRLIRIVPSIGDRIEKI